MFWVFGLLCFPIGEPVQTQIGEQTGKSYRNIANIVYSIDPPQKMISVNLIGGLGNQLFQIATTIAYCIKYRTHFVFPYSEVLTVGIERPTYWNTLLCALKKFTTADNYVIHNQFLYGLPIYREPRFEYSKIPANLEDVMLNGYFQSPKYFDTYRQQVLDIMGIEEQRAKVRDEYPELIRPGEPSISLHFRLGDYKHKQEYHPVLPAEYYERALDLVPKEYLEYARVLYFCEEEDRQVVDDIMATLYEKYQLNLPIRVDSRIPDWKQLLIMSHCQINIIANSSFSWWAAYLNSDLKKTVMYPEVWFGPALAHDTAGMYPEGWLRIKYCD